MKPRADCIAPHELLRRHRLLFGLLTDPVGLQVLPADETGPREVIAYANCTCHSTLCLDVTNEYPEGATMDTDYKPGDKLYATTETGAVIHGTFFCRDGVAIILECEEGFRSFPANQIRRDFYSNIRELP